MKKGKAYLLYEDFIRLCNYFKNYDDVVSKRIVNTPHTLNNHITKIVRRKFNIEPTKDQKKEILLEALAFHDIDLETDSEYIRIIHKINSRQILNNDEIFYIYDSLVSFKIINIYSSILIKFDNEISSDLEDEYEYFKDSIK